MPISTVAGTRIEFLRSVSVRLRAKDSGADPDLKQKIDLLSLMMDTHTSLQADQAEAVLADVDPKGGNVLKRIFGYGSDPRAGRSSMKGAPVSTAGPSL